MLVDVEALLDDVEDELVGVMVGVQAPVTEGTASIPEPIGTIFDPQST